MGGGGSEWGVDEGVKGGGGRRGGGWKEGGGRRGGGRGMKKMVNNEKTSDVTEVDS